MAPQLSAVFADRQSAEHAVADLEANGFASAWIDLVSSEEPGSTDVERSLTPNMRSLTGAVVGALVLGTAGWIVGWLVSGILGSSAQSRIGGEIVAAVGGGIIGWLVGAIYFTEAPVEESYYREELIEQGSTRLTLAPTGRDDEARGILTRNGAHIQSTADDPTDRSRGYGADGPEPAAG